jgi:DNA-directed RNA polymerase subunit M
MPTKGEMQCGSCGYVEKGETKITDKKVKKVEIAVMQEKMIDDLPKTKYDCKKCGHNQAFFWTLQTRSSDEPETRFYKCTKCNTVNREY